MGRKNSNVRRRNNRMSAFREKGAEKRPKALPVAARQQETEALVIPDGHCPRPGRAGRGPKARFLTEEKAAKALAQAQRLRAVTGSMHAEKRYYACPIAGCGGYHLSSRETYTPGGAR